MWTEKHYVKWQKIIDSQQTASTSFHVKNTNRILEIYQFMGAENIRWNRFDFYCIANCLKPKSSSIRNVIGRIRIDRVMQARSTKN